MNSTITLPETETYSHVRKWDLENVWRLSSALKVEEIDVELLWDERYREAFCWLHDSDKLNNAYFLEHFKRVTEADLNYPIILSEERYIMDGVHRLIKAKYSGMKKIKCVQFKKDPASKKPS